MTWKELIYWVLIIIISLIAAGLIGIGLAIFNNNP